MGKKNGYGKTDRDNNLELLVEHCVIQRQILWIKYIPPVSNKVVKSIRKCIN